MAMAELPPISVAEYVRSLGNSLNRSRVMGLSEAGAFCSSKSTTPDVTTRYSFGREIGRGHIGVVRICRDLTSDKEYACKTILKSSIQTEEDVNELWSEVLSMLRMQQKLPDHDGIVRLHEVYDDDESTHLIMDYCCGGDLFSHIDLRKQLSEAETAYILKQLVRALEKIHSCELIHRDLKPENILLTEPAGEKGFKYLLKIADFGLCVPIGRGKKAKGVAGSSFYMAPEVILEKPYGKEVDIWSLGVIVYTCLAGWLPFWGEGVEAVFHAVCSTKPDFKSHPWPGISFGVQNLICRMLERDPAKRIRVTEILKHPWMLRHCPELAGEVPAFRPAWHPKVAPPTIARTQTKPEDPETIVQDVASKSVEDTAHELEQSAMADAPKAVPLPLPPPLAEPQKDPPKPGTLSGMDPEPSMHMAHNICGPHLFINRALREAGTRGPGGFFFGGGAANPKKTKGDAVVAAEPAAVTAAARKVPGPSLPSHDGKLLNTASSDENSTSTFDGPIQKPKGTAGVPVLISPSVSNDSFESCEAEPGSLDPPSATQMGQKMFEELVAKANEPEPAPLPPLPTRPKTGYGRRGDRKLQEQQQLVPQQQQQQHRLQAPPQEQPKQAEAPRPKSSWGRRRRTQAAAAAAAVVEAEAEAGSQERLQREQQSATEEQARVGIKFVGRTRTVDAFQQLASRAAASRQLQGLAEDGDDPCEPRKDGIGPVSGSIKDVVWMPLSQLVDAPPTLVVEPATNHAPPLSTKQAKVARKGRKPVSPDGPLEIEGVWTSSGELQRGPLQDPRSGQPVGAPLAAGADQDAPGLATEAVAEKGSSKKTSRKGKGRFGFWGFRSQAVAAGAQ